MCSNLEETIRATAKNAKNLLGQLGPLAWALHVMRQPAGAFAVCVEREPEKYVEIRTDEIDAERQCRKRRVVEVLEDLRCGQSVAEADLFESKGYRATINRSIVVYAAAVLEQFLDDAGRKIYRSREDMDWPGSFRARVDRLESVGVVLHCCKHYPEADLCALYRHKIVHVDARIDCKLIEQVAQIKKRTGKQVGFRLSDDKSSVVWDPRGGQELCCAWTGKKISLAIDEVILPLLRDAQAFVAEAEGVLLNAARNVTDPSASAE